MARKVKKLVADIEWAESAGLDTAWMPQVPDDFDCLTMVALMAAHTSRIELGTAVVPLQAQHPIALARQALSVHAMAAVRLALGVGPSHHWIIRDMLGLPYEKPAAYTRDYLQVLNAAISGPGPVDVENDSFTVHNPTVLAADPPMPVLVAALGPVMLQIAGEHADGTVLWMADEKAIGEHIAPKITKAAADAGRPAPRIVAGIPVCLCAPSEVDAAKERANRILAEAETSPNYQKLLDRGDARNVGDRCAAGDAESILARFKQLADLGAEVIKIEPPGGEISRQVSDSYFASLNRNKRSVCLDLTSDDGRARLGELVADSHAVLVNMKPSAIKRLGLTYDALREFNDRIVCVALTGFGLNGGDDPAFDYVIQAATGVAAMTGHPDGPPTLPGYSSADNSTGLAAALGLLAQIVS